MDQNLRSILTGQTCSHIIHDTSVGTPPRLYNQIARVIAVNKGNSVHENARLFALINMAMADAAISTWDSKWFYDYWRPILGRAAANAFLANRTQADAPFLNSGGAIYIPTGEIGIHDVDPVNPKQGFDSPEFGLMQPFGVDSVDDFRAPRPPAIDSKEYADALEEVKELGVFRGGRDGLEAPTSDETLVIANFWGYNGSPKSKYIVCLYGPKLAIDFDRADMFSYHS